MSFRYHRLGYKVPGEDTTYSGSQFSEDLVLKDLLGATPIGTYVEVGLYQPESHSNTWLFYQLDWHGLLIEPVDDFWEETLKKRPRDVLWKSAAGNFCGEALMHLHKNRSSLKRCCRPEDKSEMVRVDTLQVILEHFPEIRDSCRLCSIDVEGWEKEVLEGIDWKTFRPEAFIIEYVTWPEDGLVDISEEWMHLFTREGYKEVWRGEENMILTRSESCKNQS